ncbi:hypothetical protein V5O48_002875 [Marasmius crinis-equi]|uniref:Zn(2)-C6 fungal-type domain-containing protein n=1 Tax=Marasmius crinis-equi TaxID=585013 RepID=A0ABR3FUI1_9AGAR
MDDPNDPVSPSAFPARASPRSARSRADSSAKEEPRDDPRELPQGSAESNEFCLLVAGDHGGKSSFLRLLLETTPLYSAEDSSSQRQKASLSKFIQGCSTRTTSIRCTTLNVLVPQAISPKPSPKSSPKTEDVALEPNLNPNGPIQVPLALTVVDTPSITPSHVPMSASVPEEILRFVESRLAEAVDSSARNGLMHLCVYFLDPTPSYALPKFHIDTICRLSARVNVLPVIAKADTLSNQQLHGMKEVVRRDLADAGIGFGIFDQDIAPSKSTGSSEQPNGMHDEEEASKQAVKMPSLPYALISPDSYDIPIVPPRSLTSSPLPPPGPSPPPSMQDGPANEATGTGSLARFTRTFRWGSIEILNPEHSDFVSLKRAVFHHLKTLRNYTQEYLFEKFKADYLSAYRYPAYAQPQSREHTSSHSHHSREQRPHNSPPYTYPQHSAYPPPPPSHHHSYSHSSSGSSRPVLAIDTGSSSGSTPRHGHGHEQAIPASSSSRGAASGRPGHHLPPSQSILEASSSGKAAPRKEAADGEKEKNRPKKITVACNFCRSRKLKCDGVRPACVQCLKRSNPCDYQTQGRRRGAKGKKGGAAGEKDKDGSKEKEKVGKDGKSTNANGSSASSTRGSRRGKANGSREESEDAEAEGDEGEGSGTGSQDAEGDEEEDEDIEMSDPRPSSRSPEIGRSRHGSLNEYPPAHLSHPPSSYRPPSSASFAQSHLMLPSISAEFPPPHSHGRSRVSSISSLTGPSDRDREPRDRGGYELPHIATLSLPDPTTRHHQPSSRHSPRQPPPGPPHSSQRGHHTRSSSSSQHHLPPPGPHLPPPHHTQHTRSPPHHLPPPHLPSPHPHQHQHHLSASTASASHVSPHPSNSSGSAHLSPHHHHHRLPSPHRQQAQQHPSHSQATSRKRAATAPSKSGPPVGVVGGLPPPVPGPPRATEVSRGRSSTTSAGNPRPHSHTEQGVGGAPVESLGVGGSAVNVGTIGSVTAGMIRATARKTKCDGAHPSCGSCARRNLPCNYVHERGGRRGGGAASAAAASSAQASVGASSGGDKKPPSSGRGSKRLSDQEPEDPAGGGRKKMRVSE